MAVETLKVTWWPPNTNISIFYYIVQWIPASNLGPIVFSKPVNHSANQVEYVYDVNNFIHGECYSFTVIAYAVDGDNASSTSVIFQTSKCVFSFLNVRDKLSLKILNNCFIFSISFTL